MFSCAHASHKTANGRVRDGNPVVRDSGQGPTGAAGSADRRWREVGLTRHFLSTTTCRLCVDTVCASVRPPAAMTPTSLHARRLGTAFALLVATSMNVACAGDPVQLFIMPHSHCDVGWLQTVDSLSRRWLCLPSPPCCPVTPPPRVACGSICSSCDHPHHSCPTVGPRSIIQWLLLFHRCPHRFEALSQSSFCLFSPCPHNPRSPVASLPVLSHASACPWQPHAQG